MLKKCKICQKEFVTKDNGYTRVYCYECSPSYEHGNMKGRASAITSIRHAIKTELVRYKGGKCQKCGYHTSLNALQFHHIDASTKDFDLASQYNGGHLNMKLLYSEVDKCDLLCANCHAEEHDKWLLS